VRAWGRGGGSVRSDEQRMLPWRGKLLTAAGDGERLSGVSSGERALLRRVVPGVDNMEAVASLRAVELLEFWLVSWALRVLNSAQQNLGN
jgi:hypothetical protein